MRTYTRPLTLGLAPSSPTAYHALPGRHAPEEEVPHAPLEGPVCRLLPEGLRVMGTDASGEGALVLLTEPAGSSARCPLCDRRSSRVHSRYLRTLADLP